MNKTRPYGPEPPDPAAWTGETSLDAETPKAARRYNFLLGGKDNFHVDRVAAHQLEDAFPYARVAAEENRRFVLRMVHHLAAEHGVRQFLDVGSGLPTATNVHNVAQRIHRDARVVYVDHDPLVAVHSRALMAGTREGRCEFIPGDLLHPRMLLAETALRATLDLGEPIAVLMMAVLHFIPDTDEPHQRVRTLLDGMPNGSFLAISHGSGELLPANIQAALAAVANDPAQGALVTRTREQVAAFADGMELLDLGVAPIVDWLPGGDPQPVSVPEQAPSFGLLAWR